MAELRNPTLTDRDIQNMNSFLGHVLDDYKAGTITKEVVVTSLAHVMASLDIGNYPEAINWFEQGRKMIRS